MILFFYGRVFQKSAAVAFFLFKTKLFSHSGCLKVLASTFWLEERIRPCQPSQTSPWRTVNPCLRGGLLCSNRWGYWYVSLRKERFWYNYVLTVAVVPSFNCFILTERAWTDQRPLHLSAMEDHSPLVFYLVCNHILLTFHFSKQSGNED